MGPTGGKNAEEARLPVVMNFLRTSSAATDAGSLMTRFFNALKTAVDFDIGAYLIDDGGRTEGRVYAASLVPPAASDDFSRGFLRRAAIFCPGFFEEMLPDLDVSVLMEDGKGRVSPGPRRKIMHSLELPLVLEGEPAGVITLGSYRDESPFSGTSTINAMAEHLQKALERLLVNSAAEETRLRNILFSISDGVFLMDRAGRLTAVNPMALELISLFCSDCAECISKDDGQPAAGCGCEFAGFIMKAVAVGVSAGTMAKGAEIKNADGRTLALSVSAVAGADRWRYSHVITARDVTDEKLMQKSMLISSKLASIGEMVAGIAHEINNPLQAILVNMELLDGRLAEAEAKRLGIIKGGVMRIRDIVKDLLVFARDETTGAEKADVNILIEKSADIVKAQ
ncbi:MAG: hypothetical protein HZB83_02520, partial [Deltaproteobacteria bacterium]|nr:hypothetical protein [Deltaproteobacteria bacterium]